jgi:hypothetical protein
MSCRTARRCRSADRRAAPHRRLKPRCSGSFLEVIRKPEREGDDGERRIGLARGRRSSDDGRVGAPPFLRADDASKPTSSGEAVFRLCDSIGCWHGFEEGSWTAPQASSSFSRHRLRCRNGSSSPQPGSRQVDGIFSRAASIDEGGSALKVPLSPRRVACNVS